jgi:hypothetical protein
MATNLTKDDVTVLKGLAISAIVFHNFFHSIFHKTQENEINFDPARFTYFLREFPFSPNEWIQRQANPLF